MSDRDSGHMLDELQYARAELDRIRRLVVRETAVTVRGVTYWPGWVQKEFGPIDEEAA